MDRTDRRSADRRSRIPAFRYPERRSGFDRRTPPADSWRGRYRATLLWYRRTPAALGAVLGLMLALNAADLVLTLHALDRGAVEVNPVMAQMFEAGTAPAALFKLTVGVLVAGVIWALRRYRRILEASLIVVAILGALVVYHVAAAGQLPA